MMVHFKYENSPYPIRVDIQDAYRNYWNTLAHPGTWFTGKERVAIAAEVRNASACSFCQERKKALSPYGVNGEHYSDNILDNTVVDAVHRVITDQSRITASYIETNQSQGLSEAPYIELVSIAVIVFSIDEFNRALNLPLEPLPEPVDGEPSRYRPAQVVKNDAFVAMLPADGATGNESDLWQKGRTAYVVRALSLVPNAVREWKGVAAVQYLSEDLILAMSADTGRSLNRIQMELIASRVSSINECFY